MILVPRDTPGVTRRAARCRCSATTTRRTATCEVLFENVRVPVGNMLLGEGRGFEIAQGRLGPGPHPPLHAARSALAERALELMCQRARQRASRSASRSPSRRVTRERIAEARCMIDQARLLTLKAA